MLGFQVEPEHERQQPLPHEASEQRDDTFGDRQATVGRARLSVARELGDLDRCSRLDRLTASDRKRASLVWPGHAASTFSDVEARALRGAQGLIAKMRIFDACCAHREKQLDCDFVSDESMMSQL